MRWRLMLAIWACGLYGDLVAAVEPNDTFLTSTVLPAGTLSVSDELTVSLPPDTLLGIQDHLGQVYYVDDDFSPIGSGTASGVENIQTNSGSINFLVTGFGDDGFVGSHSESGSYRVFVDVYDLFGDPLDSFQEDRTLEPGVVHEFTFSNFEWIGGTCDVYIDNTVGGSGGSDVDFFTFTGLTPGVSFTAQTLAPELPTADAVMAWFGAGGVQLAFDDDSGENLMSLISGVVPESGELTFAVSGVGDNNFIGEHGEEFSYELSITLEVPAFTADFNNDHVVNGDDLAIWKNSFGGVGADADGDGDSDGADFLQWQQQFGSGATAAAVPEPRTALIIFAGLAALAGRRRP